MYYIIRMLALEDQAKLHGHSQRGSTGHYRHRPELRTGLRRWQCYCGELLAPGCCCWAQGSCADVGVAGPVQLLLSTGEMICLLPGLHRRDRHLEPVSVSLA